ncbi:pentapeptide repeat-containing protein (plasmid) [Embleya sp. NBC_00888]|uniref:pentapeptide repeat-containing protein n=1 Tax=Embleya sp. NBC_00888 TaxID=2975960 RepID=UPI002F9078F7|nr:pentapeptide repeat-containing protein [Embleya sp. NBC_00888]
MSGHTACLAHLTGAERDAYLAGLCPGSHIDHRGTTFAEALLAALLDALRTPTRALHLGFADFGSAVFESEAGFDAAIFERGASFERADFRRTAVFHSARFKGHAEFKAATFGGRAMFEMAVFEESALFDSVTFEHDAGFSQATFKDIVTFETAAAFEGNADFEDAHFEDGAKFSSASFERRAWFKSATFGGTVRFDEVTFEERAIFESAVFGYIAMFEAAIFAGEADFRSAAVQHHALFQSATFRGAARFEAATFGGELRFDRAGFERPDQLGPFVCAGRVGLSEAVFGGSVTLSFAARRVECRRTRWTSTAEIRLRYATVDFSHSSFASPLALVAEAAPFALSDGRTLEEEAFAGAPDARVRLVSLRGADTRHLVLADIDLSGCLFTGAVHLDRIRLEGVCVFDTTPPRPRRWGLGPRFTPRRTLAEEHHWRAGRPRAARGWNRAVLDAGHVGPAQLEPVYRALRRAHEHAGNQPWAADFAYGEREMRRHDRTGTTRAERGLLHAYWLLSGYGLRASRALGWLAASIVLTVVLLMWAGIPQDSPKQEAAGRVPAGGGTVTFEIGETSPRNPTGDRFTSERFEKSLDVALGSVVFRSSGQPLTTAGGYIESVSRLSRLLLLGLAVLAVRNRVRR